MNDNDADYSRSHLPVDFLLRPAFERKNKRRKRLEAWQEWTQKHLPSPGQDEQAEQGQESRGDDRAPGKSGDLQASHGQYGPPLADVDLPSPSEVIPPATEAHKRAEEGHRPASGGSRVELSVGTGPEPEPEEFQQAVDELNAAMDALREARPELAFEDEPPPRRLAPYATAIAASVQQGETETGWGRFVLLYDPAGQTDWEGQFRIIAYIRAELDPEIAADPLISAVGWGWLTKAFETTTARYRQISGTATRVVTEGFGSKQHEPTATGFELRASWSPIAEDGERPVLARHVAAWCDALCMAAGLPPLGASALRQQSHRRQ